MNGDITLNLLAIGLLVLANAFFVAAEFALVRVRRTRIQELITGGNATANVVKDAIDHIEKYISVTQVGITLASLALGWIGEPFLAEGVLHPLLKACFSALAADHFLAVSSHGIAIGLAFFFITYIHVVAGELLPKSLALQYPERVALYLIRPLRFFAFMARPLVWLLNRTSTRIMRSVGITPAHSHSLALSEEELLMLLSESKKAGVVSDDEQKMLQRVFKFHDKTVREIMIPRPDIVGLDLRAGVEQIQHVFREGYSRLPVFDGSINNIKGIVYVKDLIYTLQDPKLIKLVDLLRECIFVPESNAVPALLREFQKARVHMAIVVDEFGDVAGLVTLEDVIEEIVGEIQDEYDSEPAQVERGKDGTVIFDGKVDLDRFKELFPTFVMPEGSYETVAGLVFQLAGRVPKETDVLKHGDLAFKVVKRDGRRLRKIAIKRLVVERAPESNATEGALAADIAQAQILASVPEESTAPSSASQRLRPASSESGRMRSPDDGIEVPKAPAEEKRSTSRPNAPAAP